MGFTGDQGVIIPGNNIRNLMLKEEVLEAVEREQFHIWSVGNINEGILILTGVKAGSCRDDGKFEENSVNAKVDAQIENLAKQMKAYSSGKD